MTDKTHHVNSLHAFASSVPLGLDGSRRATSSRDSGGLLVQLAVALTVFTVGLLGTVAATYVNSRATRETLTNDLVSNAFTNAIEQMEASNFEDLYQDFQGRRLNLSGDVVAGDPSVGGVVVERYGEQQLADLIDGDGHTAQVEVTFFVDETNLPEEFGPTTDLDGDGKASNNDTAGLYKALPTRLSVTFDLFGEDVTKEMYVVLGE